jgi:hypothetical protein
MAKMWVVKSAFRGDGKRRIQWLVKEGEELIPVLRTEKDAEEFIAKVREQQGT